MFFIGTPCTYAQITASMITWLSKLSEVNHVAFYQELFYIMYLVIAQ